MRGLIIFFGLGLVGAASAATPVEAGPRPPATRPVAVAAASVVPAAVAMMAAVPPVDTRPDVAVETKATAKPAANAAREWAPLGCTRVGVRMVC